MEFLSFPDYYGHEHKNVITMSFICMTVKESSALQKHFKNNNNYTFDNEFYFIRTEISHQISLCEKAFRILLPPIREAKRVSHT